ncbi:MAG: 16S rRNA (uracil(1498)-N(3))-methyltransferase [Bacteroidales bacterium]|nr:16S rRNA (uracil(1498)-N(3))-methyltransferase [Bacteroidales bacterium]
MKENLHIFYVPEAATASAGTLIYLSEEEAAHCSRVLRLKTSDFITVIDGKGKMYTAQLSECRKDTVSAVITEVFTDVYQCPYYNHIGIAPTKNIDRFEWFVEKAAEFGIDEITPLLCQHSERKVLKLDRVEKILVSAIKQSGNAVMPKLNPLTPFDSFMKNVAAESAVKLIAHCESGMEKVFFGNAVKKAERSITLIGPEGDFSLEEIALALKSGFKAVTLGQTRLRTETAGVSVCAFLSCINNS